MAISSAATNLLGVILPEWHLLLQEWSASGRLSAAAQETLLLDGDPQAFQDLVNQWSLGDFQAIPEIVLLSNTDINGALGAYAQSTGKIYLNADWLSTATQDAVNAVLTEELGHYLDSKLNENDTQGDEGEYFSGLLGRVALTDSQNTDLRTGSDAGTITIDGLIVEAEFAAATAYQFGSTRYDVVNDIATGNDGSIYFVASSKGESFVGSKGLGGYDTYLLRYENSQVTLVSQIGNALDNVGKKLTVDKDNNVFILGTTQGSLGGTSFGNDDIFVSKFSKDGVLQWTFQAGSSADKPANIFISKDGNIYISGQCKSDFQGLGAGSFVENKSILSNESTLLNTFTRLNYDNSSFITKLSASGEVLKSIVTNGSITDLRQADDGRIAISGDGFFPISQSDYRIGAFTAVIDFEANAYSWSALTSSTDNNTRSKGLIFDASGNLYLAGQIDGGAQLDNVPLAGYTDIFLVKYDITGSRSWTKTIGSRADDFVSSLAMGADNFLYLTGIAGGGLLSNGTPILGRESAYLDSFVARLNTDGSLLRDRLVGRSSLFTSSSALQVDAYSRMTIAGSTDFGIDGKGTIGSSDAYLIQRSFNSQSTGTPTLSGVFKAEQAISIDKTPVQDADNFTGYTPVYNYSFEVSNDNGTTWTKLNSTDATDNNSTYKLTSVEVGKKVRGVVSYLDGYGTNEAVSTSASITITFGNSAPTNLTLTSSGIQDDSVAGTVIGTLAAADPDAGSTFTYALVAGTGGDDADNALVEIVGNQVRVKSAAAINFETNPVLNLNIRVTDNGNPGLTYTKAFTASVINVEENAVPAAIPSVSVAVIANGNEADGSPVVFQFERTGDISASLSVGYQLFGTAQAGSDYSGSTTGTISFATGSATATLSLPALADGALIDPGETIIARIDPAFSYSISAGKQTATATITAEGMVVSTSRLNYPSHSSGEQKNFSAFAVLKTDGTVVAWGNGQNGGIVPFGLSNVSQVFSNQVGFAALKNDGTVVAWGNGNFGKEPSGLSDVINIFGNKYSFAALKANGSVVTWGTSGGDSSGVAGKLSSGVSQIFSNDYAFAALKSDGSVVSWGDSSQGGSAPTGLSGVNEIFSTSEAFAALMSDGSVTSWGNPGMGGAAPTGLRGVSQIFSTSAAFAALKTDGTVVTWGNSGRGGVAPVGLTSVSQIFSTSEAFAALQTDGTVITWGNSSQGGSAPTGLKDVSQIFSTGIDFGSAFAALKSDGTVVAWGDIYRGGIAPTGLSGVSQIFSNTGAFAALKTDGTVVAWGDISRGGTAPAGLSGVCQIYSTDYAFAALKTDGSVVTWGFQGSGGDSSGESAQLQSGIVGFANPFTDDRLSIVTTANQAPTDIILTSSGIQENSAAATVIGTLSATDPDAGSTFTYALVAGNGTNDVDNALVDIVGNEVRVKSGASIDFETNPVLNLNIRVTDNGNPGLTYTKAFTASVINVEENAVPAAIPSVSVAVIANGNEADGSPVVFQFERTGDISASLSVGYQLFGTAQAGSDYSGSTTGTVSFAAGSATANLSLPALADGALIDPGETIIARINPLTNYTITPGKQFATATITAEGMVVTSHGQKLQGSSQGEKQNMSSFAALKADGTVVAWGNPSKGGLAPVGLTGVTQIFSNTESFAALKSDGTVVTWGAIANRGTAPAGLSGVIQIFSTDEIGRSAFAALKSDGTVVAWGVTEVGGTAPTGLSSVSQIVSTCKAFAALKADGSVVAWGDSANGGTAPTGLSGVTHIFSNQYAFAALRNDGTVVCWGNPYCGNSAPSGLSGVSKIFSNNSSFAALKNDGTVVCWGNPYSGGTAPTGLGGVSNIFSNGNAFVALKSDGTVVGWGDSNYGSTVPIGLSDVTQISSNDYCFAALKSDGTVVAWGDPSYGGIAPAGLTGVTQIFSNFYSFAALKSDGTVVAWGATNSGGTAPAGLSGVTQIFSTQGGFAALKNDGTVVAWGQTYAGGTAPAGLNEVVGFANPYTDDRLFTFSPIITLADSAASVLEDGAPNLIYTFTRSGLTNSTLTVDYTIGGTADSTDYTGATPGTGKTITFAAGASTATLTVDPTADTTIEPDDTVALTLATGTGYSIGTTTPVTGTISNDDFPVAQIVESVGSNLLKKLSSGLYVAQRTETGAQEAPISKDGTQIYAGIYGSDWQVLAAEQVNGVNQLLWKNSAVNRLHVWSLDSNWNWTASSGWDEPNSAAGQQLESQFGIDLDGNGTVATIKQTVESDGSVRLTLNDGKYWAEPIAAGVAPVAIRNGGVQIYTNIYGPQWQVLGAETINGINQVLWREISVNRLHVWTLDASWNRTVSGGLIDPSSAEGQQLEVSFQQDLNGDGVIAAPTTAVENAGSTQLLQGTGKRYSVQGTTPGAAAVAIKKDGAQIYAGIYGADWQVLAAESVGGVNQVLWKNTSANRLHVWNLDANWTWTSSAGWDETTSSRGIELETQFGIDLNGDGKVAQPSSSVEEQGSVWLIKGSGNTYNARSTAAGVAAVAIKKDGVQIAQGIYGNDWQVLAAETVNGTNQLLWQNTPANRLHVWSLDSNWNWKSSAGWDEPTSSIGQQLEADFGIDLDGNGTVATPTTSIETAGLISLLKGSGNKYSIQSTAAGSNPIAVIKDGVQVYAGIYGNDWQVLAAETVNGTNQVLWKNTSANRLHVWNLDTNWAWKSSAGWDEPASAVGQQLEADFGIDLDGNGIVATPTTKIETAGLISLLKGSGNKYSIQATAAGSSPIAVIKDGVQVYAGIYGNDWEVLAAEQVNGVNQVLWKNISANRLHVWSLNSSWSWVSSAGWDEPTSTIGQQLEAAFGIDLDGNGTVATPTATNTTIENKGDISLLKGSGNRYSALSTVPGSSAVAISNGGSQIYEGIYGTEWQVLAADTISGVNQVLWMNNGVSRLHVWTLDGNWNRTASSGLIDPLSGVGKELEAQFGIDTNADGIIRTYKLGSSTVDLITGGTGDEFFSPQGVAASGVDRIITGGGRNQIQLQASNGGNFYASNGEADLLLIEGFDSSKDELLVAANKAYGTTPLTLLAGTGVGLYEDRNGDGIYNSNNDELLALLKGTNSLPSGAIVLG